MLFYYFANKEAVYRAVLVRVVSAMVAIHEQFRGDPGPIGLAEVIDGLTQYAAANLCALKVLHREIMDDGPYLPDLADEYLRPLFERGGAEVERNMEEGVFRRGDARQLLAGVGGLTLYYFLIAPLLAHIWKGDPLSPVALAKRTRAVRELLMHGLAGPAAREEAR